MSPTNTSKAPPMMSQYGNSMFACPTRAFSRKLATQASAPAHSLYWRLLFLGPGLRKYTPTLSPLTQASSQRRYASPVDDKSKKNSLN
jgi:hypothetical protein